MITPVVHPRIADDRVALAAVAWSVADFTPEAAANLGVPVPGALARAVPKRQAEYVAGRYCARAALRASGCTDGRIPPPGDDRAPVWPPGFVGSITHTAGYAAAAAAPASVARGIGLDSEALIRPDTAERVAHMVLTPGSVEEHLDRFWPDWTPAERLTLLFSAKESVFKCLFPLTRVFFGFHDAEMADCDAARRTLSFALRRALSAEFPAGARVVARWERTPGLVHTAVALPVATVPRPVDPRTHASPR